MVPLKAIQALALGGWLAILFVLSLYIWKNDKNRDDSETIQKRFISMAICCFLSPLHVVAFIYFHEQDEAKYLVWLGFSTIGLFAAVILPLLLTSILFLGPLVDQFFLNPELGFPSTQVDLRMLRNYLVAPLAEELVFRACICGLLVYGGWSHTFAGVVSPLMFGFAHLHHAKEHMRHAGYGWKKSIQMAGFQACYTTIFGIYASYIYLRTGHLIAPFISHAFCNFMGLPEVHRLADSNLLKFVYVAGILGGNK